MQNFLEAVATAADRRVAITTPAVRLVDGVGDALPGLTIDRFGSTLVAKAHLRHQADLVSKNASFLCEALRARALYLDAHEAQAAGSGLTLLTGDASEESIIEEWGIRSIIAPCRHRNVGYFTDAAGLRSWLETRALSGRVVNLFCFTGSLGVLAARRGAKEVIQIDSSKFALSWARKNWEANDALHAGTSMRFIPEDAERYLERLHRQQSRGGTPCELIIIDAPAMGRSTAGTFALEEQLATFAVLARQVLAPGGWLVLAGNQRELTTPWFSSIAEDAGASTVIPLPRRSDLTAPEEESATMRGVIARW